MVIVKGPILLVGSEDLISAGDRRQQLIRADP